MAQNYRLENIEEEVVQYILDFARQSQITLAFASKIWRLLGMSLENVEKT